MGYNVSCEPASPVVRPLKIVVAGGFGAGKTTLVGTVSEVEPLVTEAVLTQAGQHIDDLTGVEGKKTTTVAMDFGKITLPSPTDTIVVMLFGTPGQERFRSMWDELSQRAAGAVVLADTRRLDDAFDAINYFEQRGTVFIVAVNQFDGAPIYLLDEIREALELGAHVPVLSCDARDRTSVLDVLKELVKHALAQSLPTGAPGACL